jgi:hypothetical protein
MYGWYGPAFMARNYSVLFFDGPGQGLTPRRPPYMPFYPAVGGWVGGWAVAAWVGAPVRLPPGAGVGWVGLTSGGSPDGL